MNGVEQGEQDPIRRRIYRTGLAAFAGFAILAIGFYAGRDNESETARPPSFDERAEQIDGHEIAEGKGSGNFPLEEHIDKGGSVTAIYDGPEKTVSFALTDNGIMLGTLEVVNGGGTGGGSAGVGDMELAEAVRVENASPDTEWKLIELSETPEDE